MMRLGVLDAEFPPPMSHSPRQIIHILDTGFHPLATSRKVCGAWRERSEAKGRWHSAKHWSTLEIEPASARKTWLHGSSAINRLLHGSKAANAGSMWLKSLFCHGQSGSTRRRYWQLLKPPRSLTTVYNPYLFADAHTVSRPTSGTRFQKPSFPFLGSGKFEKSGCKKLATNRESKNK